MKSELWQRLRAARDYADLKQENVAVACSVSRPAVSQWEAKDPKKRTTPSIEQLKVIAKVCKVPMEYLLNDDADASEVWSYRSRKVEAPDPPMPPSILTEQSAQDFIEASFLGAVQYEMLQKRPDLAIGFQRSVLGQSNLSVTPDFSLLNVLVEIRSADRDLQEACGQLLMAERLHGGRATKVIIAHGEGCREDRHAWDDFHKAFDVLVVPVETPSDAAAAIAALF